MKVLYMSGYTDDAIVRHGVLGAGMAFLSKPFTPDALALKIHEVLGNSAAHRRPRGRDTHGTGGQWQWRLGPGRPAREDVGTTRPSRV